jgi:hypothetical protein
MAKDQQTFRNDKSFPIYISVEPWPKCFELEPGDTLTLIYEPSGEGGGLDVSVPNERELVIWPMGRHDSVEFLLNGESAEGRSWVFKHERASIAAPAEPGDAVDPYADLDGVIDAWVKATGSTLFTSEGEKPSRFFHIPGDPPHECFRITVFPPSGGRIVVQAAAIDTNDDTEEEMIRITEGSLAELDAMMAAALATIESWKQRHVRSWSEGHEWHPRPPHHWERIGGGILLAAFLTSVVSDHQGWRLFGGHDGKVAIGLGILVFLLAYRIVHLARRR